MTDEKEQPKTKIIKRKPMNQNLLLGLLILCLAGLVYVAVLFQSQGAQCIQNPLQFAAQQFSEASGVDFYGEGTFVGPASPIVYLDLGIILGTTFLS